MLDGWGKKWIASGLVAGGPLISNAGALDYAIDRDSPALSQNFDYSGGTILPAPNVPPAAPVDTPRVSAPTLEPDGRERFAFYLRP